MPPSRIRLFPPTLPEAVGDVSLLTDDEFKALLAETRTPKAFDHSVERSTELAAKLGRDPDDVRLLLSVLEFLYQQTNKRAKDEITLRALITESLSSSNVADKDKLVVRLLKLLTFNEYVDKSRKLRRLKEGLLKNAVSFSSFVDLRPNFDTERTAIIEFVPLIQFKVTTDARGDDADLLFQLDESTLEKLRQAVDDIQKKLATLRVDTNIATRITKQ